MDKINFHTDNIDETIIGYTTIDNSNIFSELIVSKNSITIRFIDLNNKFNISLFKLPSDASFVFKNKSSTYLLFNLKLIKTSLMMIDRNTSANEFVFSSQGFLYSNDVNLNFHQEFCSLSIYADGIKNWTGSTVKVTNIIEKLRTNRYPSEEDSIEFNHKIPEIGSIGLHYDIIYGGLNGMHTFGIEVNPHVKLCYNHPVKVDKLIDAYINLYMLMRFFIGEAINVSDVKISSLSLHNAQEIQLYIPEKDANKRNKYFQMFLPYSSRFMTKSDYSFPVYIFKNYFSPEYHDIKELLKKYVTYSMIDNQEEQFLGFYRVAEAMTLQTSYFVEESELSNLLARAKPLLSKIFPNTSIPQFTRAIKRANATKNNTERCIHHFIEKLPKPVISKLNIDSINISEVCHSRNKIVHRPLFTETPENIQNNKKFVDTIAKLALLLRLGVTTNELKDIITNKF